MIPTLVVNLVLGMGVIAYLAEWCCPSGGSFQIVYNLYKMREHHIEHHMLTQKVRSYARHVWQPQYWPDLCQLAYGQ
jgi:hypothetical protein